MDDPFGSARRKLARAQFHIQDLKARVRAFDESNPYETVADVNPENPNELIHKIKLGKPFPEWISEIAGDAINNLREALDHTAYAVARPPRRHCYFPFGSDANGWENSANGNCQHVPEEIVALFRGFQPYKGGDDLLWALNQISRTNKHTTLTTFIVSATREEQVTLHYNPGAYGFYVVFPPQLRWDSTNQEIKIARSSISTPERYFQFEHRVTAFVAFEQVSVVSSQEASGILDALASKVEGIILATEAEARRLFPDRF